MQLGSKQQQKDTYWMKMVFCSVLQPADLSQWFLTHSTKEDCVWLERRLQ